MNIKVLKPQLNNNIESTCDCASSKYSLYPRLSDTSYAAEQSSIGTMDRKDSTVLCKCSRLSISFVWLLGMLSVQLMVIRWDKHIGRDKITSKRCSVANEICWRIENHVHIIWCEYYCVVLTSSLM